MSNLVYVAGNIAAGKSTTSTRLAAAINGRLIPEQADENPYLPSFYEDMARWTFHTDVHFLATRAATVVREYAPGGAPAVFDRSYLEGALFADVAHRAGLSTDDEFASFSLLLRTFALILPQPAVVVYLRAAPSLLHARIRQRGRAFERGITLDYLTALQTVYDAWVVAQPNVIEVDTGVVDLRTDVSALSALASEVTEFLASN